MSVFYKLQLTDAGLRYSTQLFFNIQPQKNFSETTLRGGAAVFGTLSILIWIFKNK